MGRCKNADSAGMLARRVAEHYKHRADLHRQLWRLNGDGPDLEVKIHSKDHLTMRLQARTRTLGNRHFSWDWRAEEDDTASKWDNNGNVETVHSIEEGLGTPGSGRPLDRMLTEIAMAQGLRSAIARQMGLGRKPMDPMRIKIDRSVASRLFELHGKQKLTELAKIARSEDKEEITPSKQQPVLGYAGSLVFAIAPCEINIAAGNVQGPQIRAPYGKIAGGATYNGGNLFIPGRVMPEALAIAARGKRLGEVIVTNERHLDDRLIESIDIKDIGIEPGIIVKLVEDMVELREVVG